MVTKHIAQCNDTDYINKVQDMFTMAEKNIVKMRCNVKNQTTIDEYFCYQYILDVLTLSYAKLLYDINAMILFHVHQVLLLYVFSVCSSLCLYMYKDTYFKF